MEIVTLNRDDAARIANIHVDAYDNRPLTRLLYASPATDEIRKWMAESILQGWDSMLRRAVRDTTTGEIVCFAAYSFVAADSSHRWKNPPPAPQVPADLLNGEALAQMYTLHHEKRMKYMGPSAFMYLHQLTTAPKAERRGAGSMLMSFMTELADKYNLPFFLISSAPGKGLYKKYGFEEKESFDIDLSSINEPPQPNWAMVRPAARPTDPCSVPAEPLKPVRIERLKPTMDECRDFERCTDAAFNSDPLTEFCFFGADHETLDERAAKLLDHAKHPEEYVIEKALDPDTGEALGYSKWMLAADPHKKMYPFGPGWPRGANVACCEGVFGKISRHREQYFKDHNLPYSFMASLMIMPAAQRRGVGSALLRSGLKTCDERGWKAFIDASPAGAGLYRKFGWKEVVSASVNLKDYGGPDYSATVLGLIREPNAEEAPRKEVAS